MKKMPISLIVKKELLRTCQCGSKRYTVNAIWYPDNTGGAVMFLDIKEELLDSAYM
jgi:hypothetical protein